MDPRFFFYHAACIILVIGTLALINHVGELDEKRILPPPFMFQGGNLWKHLDFPKQFHFVCSRGKIFIRDQDKLYGVKPHCRQDE